MNSIEFSRKSLKYDCQTHVITYAVIPFRYFHLSFTSLFRCVASIRCLLQIQYYVSRLQSINSHFNFVRLCEPFSVRHSSSAFVCSSDSCGATPFWIMELCIRNVQQQQKKKKIAIKAKKQRTIYVNLKNLKTFESRILHMWQFDRRGW